MGHPRIVLIHATRVAIDPIVAAFSSGWPEAEVVSVLDESLALDRSAGTVPAQVLDDRIGALADHAMGMAPQGILYTCSSFGSGIEAVATRLPIPVLKPNEAMFNEAIANGPRAVMLYTFPPAKAGMEAEFHEAAQGRATPRSVFVDGALDALGQGDVQQHNALIARVAADIRDADVVMLAQFSMASAYDAVRAATNLPVLASPQSAVARMRARVCDV